MSKKKTIKTFMLIGASRTKVPIIKIAKEIGYKVVVTDINKSAEGLKCGDYNYNVSAEDTSELTKIALKHNVNCVYCGTDFGFSVSVINHALGIDAYPIKVGLLAKDKIFFKSVMEEIGIPVVNYCVADRVDEAILFFKKINQKPAVIKATNLGSSLGVIKVSSVGEVKSAYRECSRLGKTEKVLIEEYKTGTCHDVNGLMIKNKFYPCGIIDRDFKKSSSYFVQSQMKMPSTLSEKLTREMYSILENCARRLGVVTSPVKADFLLSERKIYMMEFSPRFHGELGFLHIIPLSTGMKIMHAYLDYMYSGKVNESFLKQKYSRVVTCRADVKEHAKSNYDVRKYVIESQTGKVNISL